MNVASAAFLGGEVRAQLRGVNAAARAEGEVALSASLGGQLQDPPMPPAEGGRCDFVLSASGELRYRIHHTLRGEATAIIGTAAFGTEGRELLRLQGLEGTVMLDAEQRLLACSGLLYAAVRGAAGATLRGQIVAGRSLPFAVALGVVPLVQTGARGQALFVLSADRSNLAFQLRHSAAQVTGATISRGVLGLGDRSVCTLSDGANAAQGSCRVEAQGGADALVLGDLLGNQLQVNISTRAHILGELRGVLSVPAAD